MGQLTKVYIQMSQCLQNSAGIHTWNMLRHNFLNRRPGVVVPFIPVCRKQKQTDLVGASLVYKASSRLARGYTFSPMNTHRKRCLIKQKHVWQCLLLHSQGLLMLSEGTVLFPYHQPTRSQQEWRIRTNWSPLRNQGDLRLPYNPFIC